MPLHEEIKKDVSVIIVNWNTKDLLLSCIRSIITETKEVSLEIIVVDNASTDGSQDALKKEFPEVILIQNEENLGFAKANNIGIKKCIGEYICLVNSDVEIRSRCIDKMHEYMEQNFGIGMLGPKTYYPNGNIQHSCKKFPSLWNNLCEASGMHSIFSNTKFFSGQEMTYFNHDRICAVDWLSGAFWMVRKKAVDIVGTLDESFFFYGEDTDWCRRFWEKNWKVIFFSEAEILHCHGGSSNSNDLTFHIQLLRSKMQYWKKYNNRRTIISFKIIKLIHQIRRIIMKSVLYLLKPASRKRIGTEIKLSFACAGWLLHN